MNCFRRIVALGVVLTLMAGYFAPLSLLPTRPAATQAAFPGANGKIAFTNPQDGNAEIYTMNPNGTGFLRLTNDPAGDYSPNWSPDGTKIAFNTNRDGNFEIYVMNEDGSGQTRLTNNAATETEPHWTPDGSKLVFQSNRDGNEEIYIMDADGSNQTRLTNQTGNDGLPAVSPDGTKVVFRSTRDGNEEIYVMNLDGSNQTRLTNNSTVDRHPEWSPDGAKLVFQRHDGTNYELMTMNADGSNQVQITSTGATFEHIHPQWSPDGTRIVTSKVTDGTAIFDIYTMDPDGANQSRLTTIAGWEEHADWQPRPIQAPIPTNDSTTPPPAPGSPGCPASKPSHAPQLFQIDTTSETATFYFAPTGNTSSYVIAYGYAPGDDRFGVEFPYGATDAAIAYTVNELAPHATYYFSVRGSNGCLPGDWSNTLHATTSPANSLRTGLFTAWQQMPDVVVAWGR